MGQAELVCLQWCLQKPTLPSLRTLGGSTGFLVGFPVTSPGEAASASGVPLHAGLAASSTCRTMSDQKLNECQMQRNGTMMGVLRKLKAAQVCMASALLCCAVTPIPQHRTRAQ